MTADPLPLQSWKSDLHDLLVDLIRTALAPDSPEHLAWERRTTAMQARLRHGGLDPVLTAARLDALWTTAVRDAERDPAVLRDETVSPTLPMTCPIFVADLFAAVFDRDRLVQRIRDAASFG